MDSTSREQARRLFLAEAGIDGQACVALPADASPRRYFRIEGSEPPQLLMDVAEPLSDLLLFVLIAKHLGRLGLSAPRVYASDASQGFALIEDFGGTTYTRALEQGHDEQALYRLAVDALIALHRAPDVLDVNLSPYDMDTLLQESGLFPRWYAPLLRPDIEASGFAERFDAIWRQALAAVSTSRQTVVLRDYHVDNLMLLPGRQGVAACGLLDFQDALIGARAYDLASLCQDARRDLAPGLEDELLERYLSAFPMLDRADFERDYWLLAAHRHCKVAGIFVRLAVRDGKTAYLRHQPRVLRLMERALQRCGLQPLIELLDAELPDWRRAPMQLPAACA